MYGGGSQLDPRDSIADTTPLSIIEAQKEIEEADITPDEDEDQPKPLDMTEEEVEAVSFSGREVFKIVPACNLYFRKDKHEEKQ